MISYLYCIFVFPMSFSFIIFMFLVVTFSFSLREVSLPFNVKLNSFSCCLSVKLLISPSNLNENLPRYRILGHWFLPFITLNIWCYSLQACRVSAEKSTESLLGVPLYAICYFFLAPSNILSLSLIFAILITMYLGMFIFGLILYGALCFLDLDVSFLSQVREIFSYYVFKYVHSPFLSPLECEYCVFHIVPEVCP